MSVMEGGVSGALADVDSGSKGMHVAVLPHGRGYSVSGATGIIAAALGANSTIFALRLDPSAGSVKAYIQKIRIVFTTTVAFTVPITAGRRLAVYRGSGANASGGTAITIAGQKDSTHAPSECNTAQGGDIRIATTGALTVTGITFETQEFATMSLVHVGAAGAVYEAAFEYWAADNYPITLQPGQLLAIRNPAAMDAAGTWQAAITIDWFEKP